MDALNATEIVPNLWMGGEYLPTMPHHYQATVDCRLLEDVSMPSLHHHAFLWIPFIDGPVLPPASQIDIAYWFVYQAIADGLRTIVHCTEGHNRSGLVVAKYLICYLDMPAQVAVDLIRAKRPGALTNQVFVDYILGKV